MSLKHSTNAIILNAQDNVATVLQNIGAGEQLTFKGSDLTVLVNREVLFGHKVAIKQISTGDHVYKYGVVIGKATQDIPIGEHVHLHNLISLQSRNKTVSDDSGRSYNRLG